MQGSRDTAMILPVPDACRADLAIELANGDRSLHWMRPNGQESLKFVLIQKKGLAHHFDSGSALSVGFSGLLFVGLLLALGRSLLSTLTHSRERGIAIHKVDFKAICVTLSGHDPQTGTTTRGSRYSVRCGSITRSGDRPNSSCRVVSARRVETSTKEYHHLSQLRDGF
jgi:hypothetical protein